MGVSVCVYVHVCVFVCVCVCVWLCECVCVLVRVQEGGRESNVDLGSPRSTSTNERMAIV